MYFDATYGDSTTVNLVRAILLYGTEQRIRFATVHKPRKDPQGGPPLLDAGEPVTRSFLDGLTRSLGNELPAAFLPSHVIAYSSSLVAWWEPAQVRSLFFAADCDGQSLDGQQFPHPPLLFAVQASRLMVWALTENQRPVAESWLYMAPYWNVYSDGSVCHGSMPVPGTTAIEALPKWSQAFFGSRFTGSNLGTPECTHPNGFLGMWKSLAGKTEFPVKYLIRKGTIQEMLCRNR